MTPIFDHTNHIRLWDWLYKNPGRSKHEWLEWTHNGGIVETAAAYCFACEYADEVDRVFHSSEYDHRCKSCPFENFNSGVCLNGVYRRWSRAYNTRDREKYAKQMRDYPLRTDVNVETK